MVTLRNGAPGQSPSCPAIRSIVRFQDQTESSAPLPAAPRGRTIPRANADPLQATPTYTRRLSSLVKCPLSHVGRMLASPFTFYRGAAAIMAADLAPSPVSGITVQLCGDAHLSNFGVFGTPERQLIFDINDFDETLPGPWEWDVKRMAASFEVMGRFRGFSPDNRRAIVAAGVREYRERMRRAADLPTLGVWYDQLEAGVLLNLVRQQVRVKQLDKKSARRAEKHVAKAYANDSTRVFAKRAGRGGRGAADRR